MQADITTMSSKGQIVIPAAMRKEFKEGEKLFIIQDGPRLIVKKASELDKQMIDDLEFARRTEEAWKEFEKGQFKTMDAKAFLKEIKTW